MFPSEHILTHKQINLLSMIFEERKATEARLQLVLTAIVPDLIPDDAKIDIDLKNGKLLFSRPSSGPSSNDPPLNDA